ncbi:universal stress protein [Haloarcula sp. JP-L23]|uniref:universal stress protein n=1 Tax=Haloarcula sp. JP-L23 TaxID=2716717 RepID=UPI00140F4ADE|nr:universal stress protein [Haloarcula sp. JP-L23]
MVIVAAVDRSDRASLVVEEAEELAEAFDETVHVVHALTRSEFLDLGITSAQAEEPLDMEQVREAAADMAEDATDGLSIPHESVGLVGKPASEVVKYAKENDARYIVVSPRKRSRTGKVLFGSTAQSVLLNAPCPVVSSTVKD